MGHCVHEGHPYPPAPPSADQSRTSSGVSPVRAAGRTVEQVCAAITLAQGHWQDLPDHEVADAFGAAMKLRALAEGMATELMLQAVQQGLIASSGRADVTQWVRVNAEAAGAPVTSSMARNFQHVAEIAGWRDPTVARDPALVEPAITLTEAITTGRISPQVAGRLKTDLAVVAARVPQPEARNAMEALIEGACRGDSPNELRASREAMIAEYGEPGDFERDQALAFSQREMSGWRRDDLGRYVSTLAVDAESHAVIQAAIAALCAPRPPSCEESVDGGIVVERDERTPGQRRVDALVELCRVQAADVSQRGSDTGSRAGGAANAQVIVTMRLEDLVRQLGSGVDDHGNPLTPGQVRRLACGARIIPAVLGSSSAPLDLGRAVRTATPAQVTALRLRDGGCTFDGCDRPASWCEAHHLRHWLDYGPTDLENLALLCSRHHTIVHQQGYSGTLTAGRVTWAKGPPTVASPGDSTRQG